MSVIERPVRTRERLSVERIVEEALALARQDGQHGVSMRPLAARFGVSATALYGHVASRDALLGLMLDAILADVPPLEPELTWDVSLHVAAVRMRDAFGPYPQLALEALGGHAVTALTQTSRVELVARLVGAGFAEDQADLAVHCWARWTLSFLAAADHTAEGAEAHTERAFTLGLELLLQGMRLQFDPS